MQSSDQTQPITILQLIVSVITLTTGACLVLALFTGPPSPPTEGQTSMTPIRLAAAASLLAAGFVATRLLDTKLMASLATRREAAFEQVRWGYAPSALSTSTITHAALGEGVALIGIVHYLLEGQRIVLIPVGCRLVWVAPAFPTRERLLCRVSEAQA